MDKIAVLVPCYNEEQTIGKVIDDFKRDLPEATIYVFDNNSTDQTTPIAVKHGATVFFEPRKGKGNVMRSMFQTIEADIYVLVDGDDTYPSDLARQLMEPVLRNEADMVVGNRFHYGCYQKENTRAMHLFGNRMVVGLINLLYKSKLEDVMSGYRVFSRQFVKNTAILSPGFSVETEITLHALDKRLLVKEVPIFYRNRPEGSFSKLNTVRDGMIVITTIVMLFKNYKPLVFFSALSLLLFLIGLITGSPVIIEFIRTGYILHIPLAILASSICIVSFQSMVCGLILDTVVRLYRESYEVRYMRTSRPSDVAARDRSDRETLAP